MPFSDFDGATFWPAIKQFVIDMGVEPISLGEPDDESWPKIFQAMELNGTPLSFGMDEGQVRRTLRDALATGVGARILRSRTTNQPLRSRVSEQLLVSRAA